MQKHIQNIERKLACLGEIGVRADSLSNALALAKSLLKKKQDEKARKQIDEILILFKIAASEIEGVLRNLSHADAPDAEPAKNRVPTIDEISDTVEEAFKRHLHSSALRRMVEVIALEKVRAILKDEAVPASWLDRVVEMTVAKLSSGRKQKK